uniref:Uncharacterized protein n=1 Tax=Timema tahoe TaxID=61484 RepID=A0A7R9FHV9_9NEOP|nr:unnamed protein product [Timema tahoe]
MCLFVSSLGLLTAVNCFSVRWAMRIQGLFTSAKLLALVTIVIAGIVHMSTGRFTILVYNKPFLLENSYHNSSLARVWSSVSGLLTAPSGSHAVDEKGEEGGIEGGGAILPLHILYSRPSIALLMSTFNGAFDGDYDIRNVALAFYSGLFAFGGWNFLNFVTEELQDPYKNLPRAIWIAMPIVTLVYVTANLAYFAVLTSDEMLTSTAVAVTFGDKMFGSMSWTVPVFVALSTFGGVNGILFTSARLFLVGSQEGQLPSVFSYIHIRKFTPVPSLLFTCGMSLLMLCSSDVFVLINYFSQILWLSTAACIVALLYLRRSQPDIPRPIKVNLVLPVTFLICCAFLAVVPAIADPLSTVIGLAITISGVPVYYVFIKWKGKPESYTKMLHEITSTLQAVLEVVSPEEGEKFLGPTHT